MFCQESSSVACLKCRFLERSSSRNNPPLQPLRPGHLGGRLPDPFKSDEEFMVISLRWLLLNPVPLLTNQDQSWFPSRHCHWKDVFGLSFSCLVRYSNFISLPQVISGPLGVTADINLIHRFMFGSNPPCQITFDPPVRRLGDLRVSTVHSSFEYWFHSIPEARSELGHRVPSEHSMAS